MLRPIAATVELAQYAAMDWLKLSIFLGIAALLLVACGPRGDWRTASRASAGIAPDASSTPDAVLQVYGADAWGWRGWFAIHTWIAVKRAGENFYTVYDVVGWRGWGGNPVLGIQRDIPDRHWYGARPRLLQSLRGAQAEAVIDAVDTAARAYPWATTYQAFPGPNSNTFTAWVGRQVPQLALDMPLSAIGSGYARRTPP